MIVKRLCCEPPLSPIHRIKLNIFFILFLSNSCVSTLEPYVLIHSLDRRATIRLHTGDQPYPCTACGEGFRSKSELNQHNRTTHGGLNPNSANTTIVVSGAQQLVSVISTRLGRLCLSVCVCTTFCENFSSSHYPLNYYRIIHKP